MKSVLEFSLPEEGLDFSNAYYGHKYKFVLQDLDNYLRDKIKYEEDVTTILGYEDARNKLHELLIESEVMIWN